MGTKNGTLARKNGAAKVAIDEKSLLLADKRDYDALQKAIGYQIKIIDRLLEDYYGRNRNLPKGSKFLKWNIGKNKETNAANLVEVYLNTSKATRKTVSTLRTMNAMALTAGRNGAMGDGEDGGSTTVITYDLVGAPPSGPTPPKPQP